MSWIDAVVYGVAGGLVVGGLVGLLILFHRRMNIQADWLRSLNASFETQNEFNQITHRRLTALEGPIDPEPGDIVTAEEAALFDMLDHVMTTGEMVTGTITPDGRYLFDKSKKDVDA